MTKCFTFNCWFSPSKIHRDGCRFLFVKSDHLNIGANYCGLKTSRSWLHYGGFSWLSYFIHSLSKISCAGRWLEIIWLNCCRTLHLWKYISLHSADSNNYDLQCIMSNNNFFIDILCFYSWPRLQARDIFVVDCWWVVVITQKKWDRLRPTW